MTIKNTRWFCLFFCFHFAINYVVAQDTDTYWPVGKNNFALKFPGPQVVLGFGNKTLEGCTSVTDLEGNLLFYSDGTTIFDATHRPMPNALKIPAVKNGAQGVLAVKHTLSQTKYFIFYTNASGKGNGLQYAILDTKLPGNGTRTQPLGDLVSASKRVVLSSSTTEAIAATCHENGKDIWVVIHERGNDVFRSFLITEKEVLNGPVSTIGAKRSMLSNTAGKGSMAFSPDGKLLAVAFIDDLNFSGTDVLYFDRMTGQLTNLKVNIPASSMEYDHYGVCFSPNNKLLYISFLHNGELIQLDLTAKNILKSKRVFKSKRKAAMGLPKIGPDGKMYIPRQDQAYLSVVDQPDIYGLASGFKEMGYQLPGYLKFGLGTPQVYAPKPAIEIDSVIKEDGICNNDGVIKIFASTVNPPLFYSIDGGVSFKQSPVFEGLNPGNYFVEVKDNDGYRNMHGVVKIKDKNPIEITVNKEFCLMDSGFTLVALPKGGEWQGNGITGNTFNPVKAGAGIHKIKYLYDAGCGFSSTASLQVYSPDNLEIIGGGVVVCEDEKVNIRVAHHQTLRNCQWVINGERLVDNICDSLEFVPAKSQCYSTYFSATDTNGCLSASYKENLVCHQPKPEADFEMDKTVASTLDSVRFVNRSIKGDLFEWHFGDGTSSTEKNPVHRYNNPGNFSVELVVSDQSGQCRDLLKKEKVIIIEKSDKKDESYLPVPEPVSPVNGSSFYGNLNQSTPGSSDKK